MDFTAKKKKGELLDRLLVACAGYFLSFFVVIELLGNVPDSV